MNTTLARNLVPTFGLLTLFISAALAAPAPTVAQDGTAPASGATTDTNAPASGATATASSGGSSDTTTSTGTASGGAATSSTTAHASAEGAAGTASPTHHSPPAGEGVGEAPDPPCTDAPTFDPSTPRFELQFGGGYAALFHTWRQSSDFNVAGAHIDGLYQGPLYRAEVAFAFGGVSLSAIWTHLFLNHDGAPDYAELGLISGEIGVQCACRGSFYVWSFGIELGGDVIGGPRTTLFASIEHRSMFYIVEGLFIGFDVDIATFVGLTFGGPSGGGILGSIFLGYSLG